MQRYFIELSFKGTGYHGWQIQDNALSVQETLNRALTILLKEEITTIGAGRTDTGVHAKHFVAHFDSIHPNLDSKKELIYSLNRIIPSDISVYTIKSVKPDAHARFDAISRTYKYYISRKKDPFLDDLAWQFTGELDIDSIKKATPILLNCTDFASFSKVGSDNRTSICKIFHLEWEETGGLLIFTIKADRFLRNMVRAIVGTLFEVGRGKINNEGFTKIIESKNRSLAGTSAPAKGLYLIDIEYPEKIYLK